MEVRMKGRDKAFEDLVLKAHEAGMRAGQAVVPVPMHVQGYAPVMEGPCGFAWVTVRPGNSPFANFLKRAKLADKAYGGGVSVWVSEFGQSVARKEAYARAYAAVLQDAGVKAYADSRLD
jgi:hypothetical protein